MATTWAIYISSGPIDVCSVYCEEAVRRRTIAMFLSSLLKMVPERAVREVKVQTIGRTGAMSGGESSESG